MFCKCGCGNKTSMITTSRPSRGLIKGNYRSYLPGHNVRDRFGKRAQRWKNGNRSFRKIAERAIGMKLPKHSCIHHIDGDRNNNKRSNFVVCENKNYHKLLHKRLNAYLSCGCADWWKCSFCIQYDSLDNLHLRPDGRAAYH